MANNIYVGNRYVPIFANPVEWDNLRQYEPLTIVTYEGTSYTSRQTVPVGTALSDTDYWVVTGNYNQQVEEYRQAVATLSETVSGNTEDINNLKPRVADLEMITNRKYVFIGDSYINITTYYNNAYVTPACSVLGATVGTDAWRFGAGGAGFLAETQGSTFEDVLDTAYNALTTQADSITDVIVAGGCNDANGGYTEQQLGEAIVAFFNKAKTYFPNAHFYLACIGGFQDFAHMNPLVTTRRVYNATNISGVTVITNACIPMLNNASFYGDYTHPSTDGLRDIGILIGTAVRDRCGYGHFNVKRNVLTPTTYSPDISAHEGDIRFEMSPNGIMLNNFNLQLTYSTAKSVAYNLGVALPVGNFARGTYAPVGLAGNTSLTQYINLIPCNVYGYNDDHTWNAYGGFLCFIYNTDSGGIDLYVKVNTGVAEGSHTVFRIEAVSSFLPF